MNTLIEHRPPCDQPFAIPQHLEYAPEKPPTCPWCIHYGSNKAKWSRGWCKHSRIIWPDKPQGFELTLPSGEAADVCTHFEFVATIIHKGLQRKGRVNLDEFLGWLQTGCLASWRTVEKYPALNHWPGPDKPVILLW
jgi:hypothetical protein